MKKSIFKKWHIALMVALVLSMTFSFAGCLDDKKDDKEEKATSVKNDDEDKDDEDSDDEDKQEKSEFEQDETVKWKDVEYKVKSAKKKTPTKYETVADGCELVILKIKIENKSEEKISYNPFYFRMENSNGQEKKTKFLGSDNKTRLDSGDLTPKGKVEGTLTFEVPKGDKNLKFSYYEPGNDKDAAFKIKINVK